MSQARPKSLLVWVALIAVVAGLAFRVATLHRYVYGFDETATALRVSGRTLPELDRDLASGALASLADVRARYQTARTTLGATVASLVVDDPQHPPLYYLAAHVWRAFGDGVPVRRGLALLFGVLLLPATWWFARTAFDAATACIMTALVALSPFHIAFAAYDREYGLWALVTALSSASLVSALRDDERRSWFAYAALSIAGLYVDAFFACVLVAHAAFVAASYRSVAPARRLRFALAAAATVIAFSPWLVVIATHWSVVDKTTGWNAAGLPARLLLAKWAFEVTTVFFDAEYVRAALLPLAAIALVLALTAAALAFARRDRSGVPLAAWLVAISTLALVVPDLLLHESRSTATRYLTPAWFGLEALVAVGLAGALRSTVRARRVAAGVAFGALLVAGVLSGVVAMRGTVSWVDAHDATLAEVARGLDARPAATVCYLDSDETALILSNAVRVPTNLGHACSIGSLAVATPDEIERFPVHGGAFVRVPLVSETQQNALVTSARAASGRAHAVSAQDRTLWEFVR